VAAGYAATTTKAGVSKNGFGHDNTAINFAAVEDLGGGLKVTAAFGIENIQYGRSVANTSTGTATTADNMIKPNNSSLTLDGSFGTLAFVAAKEAGDGLSQQALGARLDEAGFTATAGNSDNIKYTSPSMNGLKLAVNFGDATNAAGQVGQGVGSGDVKGTTVYADYAAGPMAVGANVTSYGGPGAGTSNKNRVFGSYDLGMAKVAVGFQNGGQAAGTTQKRTVLGVSMPVGAVTVALGYGKISTTTSGTTTEKHATALNVSYALSKRTAVVADITRAAGAGVASADVDTFNRVLLKHAF
jgi:hypothetical protein